MYSPNCRLTIGVKKSEGMKREKFYSKAVYYAGMAGTVAFIQVFLLVYQMEYTPTPSVSQPVFGRNIYGIKKKK